MSDITSVTSIAEFIVDNAEYNRNNTIVKTPFMDAVVVDDVLEEDPAMDMTVYSEIKSVRISYGGGEIYDIFVARVK
jgi:hypothetical protein